MASEIPKHYINERVECAEFVEAYWKPSLDRKGLKLSTRESYGSGLERHILPAFGDYRIKDIAPLHVEGFSQSKSESGLSGKTVRNLLLVLQGIFSLWTMT